MNNFGTPYARVFAKSASFTAALSDKPSGYLITAATVPVVATLYSPAGQYGGYASGFGSLRITNSTASKNIVTLATAAGSLVGNITLYPGQSVVVVSDGVSVWYVTETQGAVGVTQTAISVAQLLAFRTTPVAIVPAPTTGSIVIVDHVLFRMTRTSTAFANGGAIEFRYTDGSGTKVTADMAVGLVTGAAGIDYRSVQGITTDLTPIASAAIVATCATADFISGTGVGQITCAYRVIVP